MLEPRRTKRRAHADFANAFGDARRKNAVDAGRCQHERRERECLEQRERKPPLRRRCRDEVAHRRDANDRLIPVDGPDCLSDGRRERRRVTARANDERDRVVGPPPLRRRGVHRLGLRERQRRLLHVADHADDRVRRGAPAPPPIVTRRADWRLVAEAQLGERLADQRRERRAGAIALVEQASAQRDECPSSRRSSDSPRTDTRCSSPPAESPLLRNAAPYSSRSPLSGSWLVNPADVTPGTARTAFSVCAKRLMRRAVLAESATGRLHLHREQVRRIEAHRNREQVLQAAQQQTRRHEQHERERDLGDDERAARRTSTAGGASRADLQVALRIVSHGLQRRNHAERQADRPS